MAEPISFEGQNIVLKPAKGTEDFVGELPAYTPPDRGNMLSCWALSDEEIDWIVKNRKIWVNLCNFGNPPQPICPIANDVVFPKKYAFHVIPYATSGYKKIIQVYNSVNADVQSVLTIDGELYYFADKYQSRFVGPNFSQDIGDYFFRNATPQEAELRAQKAAIEFEANKEFKATLSPEQVQDYYDALKVIAVEYPILCRKLQAGREEVIY